MNGTTVNQESTKRRVGMPSQSGDQGKGHPLLFGFTPARMFEDWPDGGGYPKGFLEAGSRSGTLLTDDRDISL